MAEHIDPEGPLRRRILDSARTVVVEQGYAALTMRRLAREIGYSATSIYLHFENKDALLHALIEEGMEALYLQLKEAERAGTATDKVQNVCEAYVRFGLENPEYYEVMFMLHPQRMERFPADKYRRARRNLEVIGHVIREAIAVPDAAEPALLDASATWANLHGAVSLLIAQRLDLSLEREEFIARIVQRTLQGLGLETREEVGR